MRKIVVHRPGGFERLVLESHPDPAPALGEVRVSTRAAGVNFADVVVRMGLYQSAKDYVGWPITPGFEFAGVVSALGEGVHDLERGDEVFGVTRFGGYASEICVPRRQLLPLPKGVGMAQAATFPTVFLTAWYALYELVRLRPKMRVLVHSAAGGVGGALVQLARLAGCEVVAVVGGPHKVQAALEHGANVVIDKSSQNLWREVERHAGRGYQVVLDANGVETLRQSYAHLAPGGRLVVYGFHGMLRKNLGRPSWLKLAWDFVRTPRFNPLEMTDRNRGVLAFNLSYMFDEVELFLEAMSFLVGELDGGRLRPLAVTELPLERAADAHRALQSGRTVGKIALVP
jgi:NADPH:quinone reductase-like Zn-dependent oxidoreductase